jgi:hypothetical protein
MQAQRACIGIAEEGFVTGFACVLGAGLLLRTALSERCDPPSGGRRIDLPIGKR